MNNEPHSTDSIYPSADALAQSGLNDTATTRAIWTAIKHADQFGYPEIAEQLFAILERRVQASTVPGHIPVTRPSLPD